MTGTPDGAYNAYNTLVRSSALERTVATARAFFDGAFPALAQPPADRGLPDGEQARGPDVERGTCRPCSHALHTGAGAARLPRPRCWHGCRGADAPTTLPARPSAGGARLQPARRRRRLDPRLHGLPRWV